MRLSLNVSGRHLSITTAVLVSAIGIGLLSQSYIRHQENEAALATFNQQVAAFDVAFRARTQEDLNLLHRAGAAAASSQAAAVDAAAAFHGSNTPLTAR